MAIAKTMGFRVVRFYFEDLVSNLCGASRKVLNMKDIDCNAVIKETGSSHRELPLSQRIGEANLENIRKQIENTEYSWMIDVHCFKPPCG